jgi:hypothetical protein
MPSHLTFMPSAQSHHRAAACRCMNCGPWGHRPTSKCQVVHPEQLAASAYWSQLNHQSQSQESLTSISASDLALRTRLRAPHAPSDQRLFFALLNRPGKRFARWHQCACVLSLDKSQMWGVQGHPCQPAFWPCACSLAPLPHMSCHTLR